MTDLDLSQSIIAKSDQINADDLIAGPITVTISRVIKGSPEQPFDFQLVETPGRAYRPSKTMRRVIVEAWGAKTSAYAGRRLTLYREPSITFGGQKVGGIRISHMSDIAGPVVLAAQVKKGKRETFTVRPLAAAREITEGGQSHVTPSQDPPASDRTTTAGTSATAPGQSESASEPEPLNDAIARQVREMSPDEKAAFGDWLGRTGLGTKLGKMAEAYGESARDLAALVDGDVMPS
jgi:hypothetical protein